MMRPFSFLERFPPKRFPPNFSSSLLRQRGHVSTEYVLCLVCFLVFVLGIPAAHQAGLLDLMQRAYDSWFTHYSATLLDLDSIPHENPLHH